jgi:hypothetical protein
VSGLRSPRVKCDREGTYRGPARSALARGGERFESPAGVPYCTGGWRSARSGRRRVAAVGYRPARPLLHARPSGLQAGARATGPKSAEAEAELPAR